MRNDPEFSPEGALRLLDAIEFVDDPLTHGHVPGWAHGCDCPLDPYHRWNCPLTPTWAQTMRDLDCNPWTVIRPRDLAMTNGAHHAE